MNTHVVNPMIPSLNIFCNPAPFIFPKYKSSHVIHSALFPSLPHRSSLNSTRWSWEIHLPPFTASFPMISPVSSRDTKILTSLLKLQCIFTCSSRFSGCPSLIFSPVKELSSFLTPFKPMSLLLKFSLTFQKQLHGTFFYITLFILIIICEFVSCKITILSKSYSSLYHRYPSPTGKVQ